MLIFNELPTVFPWYDNPLKQERNKENVEKVCDYRLITPSNALLPFQFRKASNTAAPVEWLIVEANNGATVRNITSSLQSPVGTGLLKIAQREGYDYFTYNGIKLKSAGADITPLDFGFYNSRITFSDGAVMTSAMFHVPADSFTVTSTPYYIPPVNNYLRIEFYNVCDIRPVYYSDLTDDVPFFRQVVYLDSFITASEPELAVDGTKDGNEVTIPTFQRLGIKYRITALVADYLKVALCLLPMHDSVKITTKDSIRSGDVEKIAVTSALEANGAFSVVDLLFEQDLAVVQKECCDNLVTNECPEGVPAPTITSVVAGGGGTHVVTGTASDLGWVELYESTDGAVWKFVKIMSAAQLVSGNSFTRTGSGYTHFRVTSKNAGCNFGTSADFTI